MKTKIEQRIKKLENELENLRYGLKVVNYDILYRNLNICENSKLIMNDFCMMGQQKIKEIERLKELL